MSDRSPKQPPAVDDLLAPPPFGVAETTGDQLLPIATSMEQVLEEVPEPEPEPVLEPEPKPAQVIAPPSDPVPVPPAAPPVQPDPVAVAEPQTSSNGPIVAAVVGLLLLGVGGYVWMTRDTGSPTDGPAQAAVDSGAPSGPNAPEAPSRAATPGDGAAVPATTLPNDLDGLRKLSFERRHAGLAAASGDVPVELHVGLDLLQAEQSDEPCRTFSDALSIIESSEDPTTFSWAIDEAKLPAETDAVSCKGLAERLSAAKGEGGADESKPAPPARKAKSNSRPKPRPSRPKPPVAPPSAEPPKKPEPAKPKPAPERAPSVATKLDDDLRGLGE